jgi:hypothetical protein
MASTRASGAWALGGPTATVAPRAPAGAAAVLEDAAAAALRSLPLTDAAAEGFALIAAATSRGSFGLRVSPSRALGAASGRATMPWTPALDDAERRLHAVVAQEKMLSMSAHPHGDSFTATRAASAPTLAAPGAAFSRAQRTINADAARAAGAIHAGLTGASTTAAAAALHAAARVDAAEDGGDRAAFSPPGGRGAVGLASPPPGGVSPPRRRARSPHAAATPHPLDPSVPTDALARRRYFAAEGAETARSTNAWARSALEAATVLPGGGGGGAAAAGVPPSPPGSRALRHARSRAISLGSIGEGSWSGAAGGGIGEGMMARASSRSPSPSPGNGGRGAVLLADVLGQGGPSAPDTGRSADFDVAQRFAPHALQSEDRTFIFEGGRGARAPLALTSGGGGGGGGGGVGSVVHADAVMASAPRSRARLPAAPHSALHVAAPLQPRVARELPAEGGDGRSPSPEPRPRGAPPPRPAATSPPPRPAATSPPPRPAATSPPPRPAATSPRRAPGGEAWQAGGDDEDP